jgi:hypothetical protein
VFEIGFFDRNKANRANAENCSECRRLHEQGSGVGKSASARTVHNTWRWLDRVAELGRIGYGWPARRAAGTAV